MRITMNEKNYFGYWQGWTITIDGVKWPKGKDMVYTAQSAVDALSACFKDRNNIEVAIADLKDYKYRS